MVIKLQSPGVGSVQSDSTSDLGVVSHAHAADPIVGHCCYFPRTPSPVSTEEQRGRESLSK